MFTLNNITKNNALNYEVDSMPCPNCEGTVTIEITPDKLYAYNQGALAQQVLDLYPIDVRERFITGYCGDCWNIIFSNDEEE